MLAAFLHTSNIF